MTIQFNLSDTEFKNQFANCTLNSTLFSHEAHLRLAWILINDLGLEKAEETIQNQLQNFVASLGEKNKYHTTVTIVAMKAVHHFMQHSKTTNFKAFIIENPKLKSHFKEMINRHYSIDIFASEKAKSYFLKPDIFPFD